MSASQAKLIQFQLGHMKRLALIYVGFKDLFNSYRLLFSVCTYSSTAGKSVIADLDAIVVGFQRKFFCEKKMGLSSLVLSVSNLLMIGTSSTVYQVLIIPNQMSHEMVYSDHQKTTKIIWQGRWLSEISINISKCASGKWQVTSTAINGSVDTFQPADMLHLTKKNQKKNQDNDAVRETKETQKQNQQWYFDRGAQKLPLLKTGDRASLRNYISNT